MSPKLKYFAIAIFACTFSAFAAPRFPVAAGEDSEGFVSIFDGKSLEGWEADPVYWTVEDGVLVGEVTPETLLKANSFAIWQGGRPKDFELKVEYRVSAQGNSGINYRSSVYPVTKYALKGYQCDIDGKMKWTGQNYEEKGRTFLALRGQVTRVEPDEAPQIIGSVGEAEALAEHVNKEDWNQVHLIARGNVLTHIINGHVMSQVIDEDPKGRTAEGLIGVQVHVGPPMKIEYRNFRIKELPPVGGSAR